MISRNYPRIVISGLSGDSGKTIVTCGILVSLKNRGLDVAAFKKGPDYIDSAWLSLASGKPARNLDSFMMGFPAVKRSFLNHALERGINVIEGNRGLFDGMDSKGTHSTAQLAYCLQAPLIIVQDITKVTRTAAASLAGCLHLDPKLHIEGVILNRAAGERHVKVVKEAIEEETGIPVLGAIPKLPDKFILPSRHLGLVMPEELQESSAVMDMLNKIIEENVDLSKIISIAGSSALLQKSEPAGKINQAGVVQNNKKVTIGYFRDNSFSFYYPENLELLEKAGASLVPISTEMKFTPDQKDLLEKLDSIYIGGGFPEIDLSRLSENIELNTAIKALAEDGLPIYAECGGLMYLAQKITWRGREYPLSGILPIEIKMHHKPQGHGYAEALVDAENPFYEEEVVLKGHEFHYSEICSYDPWLKSALSIQRGKGSVEGRDGLMHKNVFATYIHVHALATPEWVTGMIKAANTYKDIKNSKIFIRG
jgi:cobyrinic acid a,c-diamide synthase